MPNVNASGSVQSQLNRSSPSASDAKLGDLLAEVISELNALKTKHNALTAKLDADAGVTDTNYTSLTGVTTTTIKDLESRY